LKAVYILLLSLGIVAPVAAQVRDIPPDVKAELQRAAPTRGDDRIVFVLDRALWTDPAVRVAIDISLSVDGGPMAVICSATSHGGVLIAPDGKSITETQIDCPMPQKDKAVRQFKTEIMVRGGTLRTQTDVASYSKK